MQATVFCGILLVTTCTPFTKIKLQIKFLHAESAMKL